jgi:hypothetical protein
MSEPIQVSTNVKPAPAGPNSRVRMGENALAVVRLEQTTLPSNNQEVPRVN